MSMKYILIISKQAGDIDRIHTAFDTADKVEHVPDMDRALKKAGRRRFDLILADIAVLARQDGARPYQDAIEAFRGYYPGIHIVVMTSPENIRMAVEAVKSGASDYITTPVTIEEVSHVAQCLNNNAINESELDYFRSRFWKVEVSEMMQTRNADMESVYKKLRAVAPATTAVLLQGETGTGKGVLAKLLHRISNRHEKSFISVHCGAIPDTLLESELFGHEKGAFTGAVKRKLGKFEIAGSGTLFLDEIGTVSPAAQIKLLQVLQDGTYSRIGGESVLSTDARVIAATNSDLVKMCDAGTFRQDLFYRLNVFPISVPPLRKRAEDIPLLANLFLRRLQARMPKPIRGISQDVIAAMTHYTWPGNIRELENVVERAYILESSDMLLPHSFPSELFSGMRGKAILQVDPALTLSDARKGAIGEFEQRYLRTLLTANNGKIKKSAENAGISSRQLSKLMERYGIKKESFKL
jgi:DNA-binding NtrC family response regulator